MSWKEGKILHVHHGDSSRSRRHKALSIFYAFSKEYLHCLPSVSTPSWLAWLTLLFSRPTVKMKIVNILNVSDINVIHMKLTHFFRGVFCIEFHKFHKGNPNSGSDKWIQYWISPPRPSTKWFLSIGLLFLVFSRTILFTSHPVLTQ